AEPAQVANVDQTAFPAPGRRPLPQRTATHHRWQTSPKFARTGGLAFLSDDHLVRSQSMRVRSLCVMLALLAACGKQDPAAPARIETRVRLARAATCESLTRQIQDTAAREMRGQVAVRKCEDAYDHTRRR